jgi:hypothetical protein
MNELIEELAKQAELNATLLFNKEKLEKFAELIVRECAELFPNVYVTIETEHGNTPVIASDYIRKHFGVV